MAILGILHGMPRLVAVIVVPMPSTVISSFHGDPTGVAHVGPM